jgi:hypothetical protein
VLLSDGSSKTQQKMFYKKIVSKKKCKKNDRKIELLLITFLSGSRRGVQNTTKNIGGENWPALALALVLALAWPSRVGKI